MSRTVDARAFAEKRGRILHAAMICFAQKGFHSTSTAEICQAASVSPGNLFHYFPTKGAIIVAVAEEDRKATAKLFADVETAPDAIGAIVQVAEHAILQFAEPLHAQIAIEVTAEAMRNPSVAALFAANDEASIEALKRLLGLGIERGQIDPELDIRSTALWLIALIEGAVGRIAVDNNAEPGPQLRTMRTLISRFLSPPTAITTDARNVSH